MKKLVILVALLTSGCLTAPDQRPQDNANWPNVEAKTPPRIPGRWVTSPTGVYVFLPNWITKQETIERLYEEIATAAPDPDPRIPEGTVGVPSGIYLHIQDPGSYSMWSSPTGLARGHTDMETYITCAWRMRPWEDERLLPALRHELLHFYTKNPCAGHKDCPSVVKPR